MLLNNSLEVRKKERKRDNFWRVFIEDSESIDFRFLDLAFGISLDYTLFLCFHVIIICIIGINFVLSISDFWPQSHCAVEEIAYKCCSTITLKIVSNFIYFSKVCLYVIQFFFFLFFVCWGVPRCSWRHATWRSFCIKRENFGFNFDVL